MPSNLDEVRQALFARADGATALPATDLDDLRAAGYTSLSVPREFGGQGLPMRDCIAAHLEVAQGSASTAIVVGMGLHLFGNEREQRTWPEADFARLSEAAAAGGLFNSAASEPALGSPSRGGSYASTAVRADDGWLINGHKQWVSGGRHLTHLLVKLTVHDDPDQPGENGLILVEGKREGLRWEETWQEALALRASDSHDLYLEDVWVPTENYIPTGPAEPNAWFPMVIAATYLGAALAARREMIRYALERVPTALGEPIATLPKIQRQIGEIDIQLQAARTLLLDAAGRWDPTHRAACMPHIVAAKHLATETAADAAQRVLRVVGAAGMQAPFERLFRDAQAGPMHPPSGDKALEIVGQAAIDRFDSA